MRQYIGARYVPRFSEVNDGNWSSVYSYEPLIIVKNGNDYYTSKKSVPVGIAITNTEYWVKTGDYNGAISNLQNQINTLNNEVDSTPKKRKFVLIGDSFGVGIIDGSHPWTTGWEDYIYSIMPAGSVFYYDAATDPLFAGSAAFTTSSELNFIGQLNYVYNNKLNDTDPGEITDIVVLGGSNESGTSQDIINAIHTFCARARSIFPNANIGMGFVGLHSRRIMTSGIYDAYSYGASVNGAAFFKELLNLGSKRSYDSGLGHWTAEGYAYYNPIIAKCVITGRTNFKWTDTIPLTLGADVTQDGQVGFNLGIVCTEKGTYAVIYNTSTFMGWVLHNNKDLGSFHTVDAFTFSGYVYTAILSGSSISDSCVVYDSSNGKFDTAAVKMAIHLDVGGNTQSHKITIGASRKLTYADKTHMSYCWNGSKLVPVLIAGDQY